MLEYPKYFLLFLLFFIMWRYAVKVNVKFKCSDFLIEINYIFKKGVSYQTVQIRVYFLFIYIYTSNYRETLDKTFNETRK